MSCKVQEGQMHKMSTHFKIFELIVYLIIDHLNYNLESIDYTV